MACAPEQVGAERMRVSARAPSPRAPVRRAAPLGIVEPWQPRAARSLPAGTGGWLGAAHGTQLLGQADAVLRVQLLDDMQRRAGNGAAGWIVQRCPGGCSCGEQPGERPPEEPVPIQRSALPVQRGPLDSVAALGGELLGGLRSRASAVVAAVREKAAAAWDGLSGMAASLGEALESRLGTLVQGLASRWEAVQAMARSAWDALAARASALADGLRSRLDQLAGGLRAGWDALKGAGRALLDRLKSMAASLLEQLKGRGGSLLTSSAGACVAPQALQQARSELGGSNALGTLDSAAGGELTGLLGQWTGLDSEGQSQSGALQGQATAATSQLGSETAAAKSGVQASGGDLTQQSTAATGQLDAESGAGLDTARGRAGTAADDVRGEAASGTSGLRGMLGALGDLVARAAEAVIGSASQESGAAQADLATKSQSLLGRLQGVARSVAARLESAVQSIRAGLDRLAGELEQRAGAAARLLEQGWAAARARASAVLGKLRAGWNALRAKAGSVWQAMRGSLLGLRGQAFSALSLAEGSSCQTGEAQSAAASLTAAQVDAPAGEALGDPVLFKGGPAPLGAPASPAALRARLGPGRPMEAGLRSRMETAMGADFSAVRVHTDGEGARAAGDLNARAFSFAGNVAFAAGEYRPGTLVGDALIAHELAHLVQQRSASRTDFEREDGSETAIELDADRSAVLAVARLWLGAKAGAEAGLESAMPQLRSGLRLRRCSGCSCNPPKLECCTESAADAGPLVPVEPKHDCEPLGEGLWDVRRVVGGTTRPSQVGLTSWSYQSALDWSGSPGASFDTACPERCTPVVTNPPSFVLSPFVYTKAGRYEAVTKGGQQIFLKAPPGTKCAGKKLPAFYVISDALGDKIKAAEAEHCRDLKVGWKQTFGLYLAAMNELKDGFCAPRLDDPTKRDAQCSDILKQRLAARTGMDHKKLADAAACYVRKTGEGRDDTKNHTLSFDTKKKQPSADCTQMELVLADDATQLPNIGKPSSEELMTGCP